MSDNVLTTAREALAAALGAAFPEWTVTPALPDVLDLPAVAVQPAPDWMSDLTPTGSGAYVAGVRLDALLLVDFTDPEGTAAALDAMSVAVLTLPDAPGGWEPIRVGPHSKVTADAWQAYGVPVTFSQDLIIESETTP